jgi:AcrR family transcriptional regulator
MAAKTIKKSKNDLVQVALDLAAKRSWGGLTLRDIAQAADISLAALHEEFVDKGDILSAYGRMLDQSVLANVVEDEDPMLSRRDVLFDILMDRYDALNDNRDAVISILHSFRGDPKQAVIGLPHLCRSMTWMMEAAGIDTSGIIGAIKVTGLTGLYLHVVRTWKEDDSPDLSKTMAALDKNLERSEKLMNTFGF